VVAALFWTTVLATFCDMISHANPEITEFQQTSTSLPRHQLRSPPRASLRAPGSTDAQPARAVFLCTFTAGHAIAVAELETFMENHTLADEMRSRLREHFLHRKHVRVAVRADRVTHQMSAELQTEVLFTIHGHWMSKITFLRNCEKACMVQVCSS
jgi:hypothetical protein